MGRPKLDNVRVQVRFTPEQNERLDALAKLLKVTRNALIRLEIQKFIERETPVKLDLSPKKGTL